MANAYNGTYPSAESLTVGSNIAGAQVQFQWAGRTIQLSVPAGENPISVVNKYLDGLTTPAKYPATEFSSGHSFGSQDLEPVEDPDDLELMTALTTDEVPEDSIIIDTITTNENPQDTRFVAGSISTNFGSTWTPDGINTIKGYQPRSNVPVLAYNPVAADIPILQGFMQGTARIGSALAELPVLRIRRGFASSGLLSGR